LNPGFPALPWWAKKPAVWYAEKRETMQMTITSDQPFATDWAVQLPNPFNTIDSAFPTVNYRWVSVRELNTPIWERAIQVPWAWMW